MFKSINLHKKTTDGEGDSDSVYFKSIMSSSEEAVSWKGLLLHTGLPSLSATGSWSELVEWIGPSGLASQVEGLSKEPDGILEEKSHCQEHERNPMELGLSCLQFPAHLGS